VMPMEYRRALEEMQQRMEEDTTGLDVLEIGMRSAE